MASPPRRSPLRIPALLAALLLLCAGCARAELARLLPRVELRATLARGRLRREARGDREAWSGSVEGRLRWPIDRPPPPSAAPPEEGPPPLRPAGRPIACVLPRLCRWERVARLRAARALGLSLSPPRPDPHATRSLR